MDLSIVIVNWNTVDYLKGCLVSIYENIKGISFEIIVVDNASSDGSSEMLRNNFPQVKLIANEENVGFAKANNQAIKESKGKYILLLNPDTLVSSGSINEMVDFMEANLKTAVSGPSLINEDRTPQRSAWMDFPTLGAFFVSYFYLYKLPRLWFVKKYELPEDVYKPTEVAHVSGACMMLRRVALEDVGLLDEQFYMYLEETDLCYRMRQRGWKTYFLPRAQILHYGRKSTEKNFFKMTQEGTKSYCVFFRKHFKNPIKIFILKAIIFIGVSLRMAISFLQFIIFRDNYKKEKVKAYFKVLKGLPSY